MRSFISTAAALALCACALLAACSPQDGSAPATKGTTGGTSDPTQAAKQPPAPHTDDTRRISIEETQAAVAAGNAVIIDVRDEVSYKTNHIKGAQSIPLQQFDKRMSELPAGKLIITYCA
jgi:3-mercaptopyruvate sulfurtransferase SseA